MTVNRRLLGWGVFFLAMGGVLLVAQTAAVSDEDIAAALRYWPVLVIALGAGVLLRATRFSLAGTMLAAAVPGLALGGLIVAGPRSMPTFDLQCSDVRPATLQARDGAFAGAATVDLRLACGDLAVAVTPGNAWQLRSGGASGRTPTVVATADRLAVSSIARQAGIGWPAAGDRWEVAIPAATRLDLRTELDMGRAALDLAGAQLGTLDLQANAADLDLDLGGATLDRLTFALNAGAAEVRLPADDFGAEMDVNAGSLAVCVPDGLGLRVRESATLAGLSLDGFVRTATGWETPGYAAATYKADVTVTANVGSVDITLEGGCQ
jgi:hypothetical protein